jgi:predicted kinase
MPTLLLICGLPGAGKTTLAKRLEQERPALRLTPDEWMAALQIDLFDESTRNAVEGLQWQIAARTLALGADVILDWGFWSRVERDDYRGRATRLGARAELHYVGLSLEALWERVDARNRERPADTAHITRAQLEQYARSFEPPTRDEVATES